MGITTRYIGNKDRGWSPGGDDLQAKPAVVHDNDKEERRDAFVDFLEMMLQDINDDKNGTVVQDAMDRKRIYAVIGALTDPAVQLPEGETGRAAIWSKMDHLVNNFELSWTGIILEGQEEEGWPRKVDTDKTVTAWYGGKCAVTGEPVDSPDSPMPALLVPQYIVQSYNHLSFEPRRFDGLWGPGCIDDISGVAGNQHVNTLPLGPTALRLWDRYMFALRPVADPLDPEHSKHSIYLQVVTLFPYACPQGLPLADGDVIHLQTCDPDQYPLPSLPLLQMQYRARHILAGIRMPGVLRHIFRGNPDGNVEELDDGDDKQDPLAGCRVSEWTSLLIAAEDTGVLSNALVHRWKKALYRNPDPARGRLARISRRRRIF